MVVGATTATAATVITGSQIKDGTISTRDVGKGAISLSRLSPGLQEQLAEASAVSASADSSSGAAGAKGDTGATGPRGAKGEQGDRGETGNRGRDGLNGKAGADGIGEKRVVKLPARGFDATNPTVSWTPDGLKFGSYEDGGASGGSVSFDKLDGLTVKDVQSLIYTASYSADGDTGGVGVPYLRIFTDDGNGGENSLVFSPNTQRDPDTQEGQLHTWAATSGTWRYNDDIGNGADQPFSQIVADHGDQKITGLYITAGFSAGKDLRALLRSWEINGQEYIFGMDPAEAPEAPENEPVHEG